MKFDFAIGNPPYQESQESTSDKPVYNEFMDAAYSVADKVELITPARFLFNVGKTPKEWNKKMLSDTHLKVSFYEQNSNKVFPNTNINGGVVITYRDAHKEFGEIGVFSHFEELRSISSRIKPFLVAGNITDLMYLQNKFFLDVLYRDYPEYEKIISSEGKERRIVSSSFEKLDVFSDYKNSENDIQILGIYSNKRKCRWINSKYIEDNGNLNSWKVVVSKSNGASGTLGEEAARIISTPVLIGPQTGHTQTFISIGKFGTRLEAEACLKYIKSKFARALLGILKITQDNPPDRWSFVPAQNFTSLSDINWTESISNIDKQLYEKYGFTEAEINFIETHVKEME